jgi:hypothetical protein
LQGAPSSGIINYMTVDDFQNTLRQFLRREPFQPFVVELSDGSVIEVGEPSVAFNGGAAVYVSPNFDLVDFASEEVRTMRPTVSGASS